MGKRLHVAKEGDGDVVCNAGHHKKNTAFKLLELLPKKENCRNQDKHPVSWFLFSNTGIIELDWGITRDAKRINLPKKL
ncbi:hypothetical protein UPYG_G00339450 [Umbra pygmaea]|uniref:Uncharacterized protein n=1 Tax=Umbra pygmaea TaxID=75934 RepID=A0ABD0WD01_UMBPY